MSRTKHQEHFVPFQIYEGQLGPLNPGCQLQSGVFTSALGCAVRRANIFPQRDRQVLELVLLSYKSNGEEHELEDQIEHPHHPRVALLTIIRRYASHCPYCCRLCRPRRGCSSEWIDELPGYNVDGFSRSKTRNRSPSNMWTRMPARFRFRPLLSSRLVGR